ncbi:TetR/AcrR family transcriptional regulator [Rhodococcus sp. NPDC003318]|uniref:TetR/AcrR family transcriptional regulator n=1 Tax=Rhodococcus sp. NPDC003318 TaxID=3364503 RepID=UPI003685CAAB
MATKHDPTSGPRAAMIGSAVDLIRERGVAATSFADVLAHSGAPRGSIYHHFPRGKSQLVEEATQAAADRLGRGVERVLDATDTVGALRALADVWRRGFETSGYRAGCPIVAAALGTEPGARSIAGTTFDTWCSLIATKLTVEGVGSARASSLSVLIVSALEGALVVAQAQGSTTPLDTVVAELELVCRAAVSR